MSVRLADQSGKTQITRVLEPDAPTDAFVSLAPHHHVPYPCSCRKRDLCYISTPNLPNACLQAPQSIQEVFIISIIIYDALRCNFTILIPSKPAFKHAERGP